MNYTLKFIVYILSKAFLYASALGFLHSLIMSIVDFEETRYWIIRAGLFLVISGLAMILHIIRKSKIPLPGKDYT